MTAKLFLDDSYQTEFDAVVTAVNENGVQLDKTAFYAMSGGQPGDTGVFKVAGRALPVITTKKGEGPQDIWHLIEGADLKVGDTVTGAIDWPTRHAHMRMHTAMHLLCSLIVGDVTGGQVGAEKSRLDFNISADSVDKEDLTRRLKDLIAQDYPVSTEWISDDELLSNPNLVRTMSVKPPVGTGQVRLVRIGADRENPVDLQPCGGTHVKSTGEIGRVAIAKIENKGKQNRRITLVFEGGTE